MSRTLIKGLGILVAFFGVWLLLAQIDSVNALVEKGQLEQAKVQALELVKLRNEYHQQFK